MSRLDQLTRWFRRGTRAEYWFQPAQLWRRVRRRRQRHGAAPLTVTAAWGLPVIVDPRESSGRSLLALNTLDLPVAEALWRLLDDDEVCADIGANIGVLSSVLAARLHRGGCLHAFEPVPSLFARLAENAAGWRPFTKVRMQLHPLALSEQAGTASLFLPADFARDKDTATLAPAPAARDGQRLEVRCVTLDELFPAEAAAPRLVKIDVEGWEAHVFRGAARLLACGRVRDVIFEELRPPPTESFAILRGHGYTIFRLARGFFRPRLAPPGAPSRGAIDVPSYLATRDPARAQRRFRAPGWQVLRSATHPPS